MRVFLIELKRSWTLLRRYPLDLFGTLVALTLTFYGLVLGAKYVAGPSAQFGDRLDGIVLGYWLWTLAIFALTSTAATIQTEALTGTLEQLYLTPLGGLRLFLVRAAASLGINLLSSVVLLAAMLWLTGQRLHFPPTLVLPLLAALLAGYGLGLGAGGLALLYKRVQRLLGLLQIFFLFLVVVPFEEINDVLSSVLPIAPAAALLRDLMARGKDLDGPALAIAMANGGVYLAVGILMFLRADREARRQGLLSQH